MLFGAPNTIIYRNAWSGFRPLKAIVIIIWKKFGATFKPLSSLANLKEPLFVENDVKSLEFLFNPIWWNLDINGNGNLFYPITILFLFACSLSQVSNLCHLILEMISLESTKLDFCIPKMMVQHHIACISFLTCLFISSLCVYGIR